MKPLGGVESVEGGTVDDSETIFIGINGRHRYIVKPNAIKIDNSIKHL